MNMPKTNLAKPVSLRQKPEAPTPGIDPSLGHAAPERLGFWRLVVTALVQLALVAGLAYAGWQVRGVILESAPKAERSQRARIARLVEVTPAEAAKAGPVIEAWGEVVPARTLVVRPEISGTLVWVDPEVTRGGRLSKGQVVARFDDKDLVLAVKQAEADVAEIKARMQIERGQGELGKRELKRLSRNITAAQRALVLREPQMAQLQAELDAAEAQVAQARNALAKVEVKTPFDALVTAESVAPGAMVAQGAEAATLVAADMFHVTMAVPSASLEWLRFDGTQTVTLSQPGVWSAGQSRTGTVVRLGAGLTETGRMIEVIVAVANPLGDTAPAATTSATPAASAAPVLPLLLESFVKARIETPPIVGTVALDRAHLRDGDTVWVMTADGVLEVREVTVVWRGSDVVLLQSGLDAGERVVTTYLATFAPGMALRTKDSDPQGSGA